MAQRARTRQHREDARRRSPPRASTRIDVGQGCRRREAREGAPAGRCTARCHPTHGLRLPAPPTPKVSKDELRAQVEKLERTVATLRARSRDAVRAVKEALSQGSRSWRPGLRPSRPPRPPSPCQAGWDKPAAKVGRADRRRGRPGARRGQALSDDRDPGDAVPPGVAVAEPEPMDEEISTTAFENLQAHLHPADEPVRVVALPVAEPARLGCRSRPAAEPGAAPSGGELA